MNHTEFVRHAMGLPPHSAEFLFGVCEGLEIPGYQIEMSPESFVIARDQSGNAFLVEKGESMGFALHRQEN